MFSLFDQRTKNQAKRKKGAKITAASKKSANNGHSKSGKKKNGAVIESDGEMENESEDDEGIWCSYVVLCFFFSFIWLCGVKIDAPPYGRMRSSYIRCYDIHVRIPCLSFESLCINLHVYLTFGTFTNILSCSSFSIFLYTDEVSDYDPTKRPTSQLDRIGQKIIVFFHHKNVLSAIEDSLLKLRVKYVKIDGSTSQKNRGALVEQFQNDNVVSVHKTYFDLVNVLFLMYVLVCALSAGIQ